MNTKLEVLYISPNKSTFVNKDVRLLSAQFNVHLKADNWYKTPSLIPLKFLSQFFFLLFRIRKYHCVIVMFAGYWSLNPVLIGKMFKKKVIIIAGGTDCVSYPSINYGSLRKPVLKKIIGWSFKNASVICPVDDSLIYFQNTFYDDSFQGIKHFFSKINTPIHVVNNGYEESKSLERKNPIKNSFVLVALCGTKERFILKGIDIIINNAAKFPQASFTIGGVSNVEKYFSSIPENVTLVGPMKQEDVIDLFTKHEFVIQISISEGFPNALCEAMVHGCIPIISPVGAMPKIVGNIGLTMTKRTDLDFQNVIKSALSLSDPDRQTMSVTAKQRVSNLFSEKIRSQQLKEIIT